MTDPEYRPKWTNRRRVIFGALVFSALCVATIVIGWLFGLEVSAPLSAVAVALVAMDGVIIAAYVFGATFEDIKLTLGN